VLEPNDSVMKRSYYIMLLGFLILPILLKCQSIEGIWYMEDQVDSGVFRIHKVTFLPSGNLYIDYDNDGTRDVHAIYKVKGNQFAVFDLPADSPCYGKTGIYAFSIQEDVATITLLTDPCEVRKKAIQIWRRRK
jgi:hypothetical protein